MGAAPTTLLKCEQHGATAGWQCSVCHAALCPDCAVTKVVPPIEMVACGRCGQLAEVLVRRKGEAQSLAQRLPEAFLFPIKGEGLAVWLGMGLWLWLTSFLGGVGALVGWGVALGSFFGLTRATALDRDSIEPDFQDFFQGVLLPVARFAIATLPIWGGLAAAVWLESKALAWAAVVLGVLWSPTAYIGAATNTNLVNLLNPVRVLGASARLGKDLGVYAAALAGVVAMMIVAVPLSWFVESLWAPVVAGVGAKMVLAFAPLVGARVAGVVLLLHGPVFGWGEEDDAHEPVLKGEKPRGALPVKETSLPAHLPTAIELPPESEPVIAPAPAVDRFAALEVNPNAARAPEVAPLDVSLLPSHGEQAAKEIRAAMRAAKPDVALDGFRATGLSAAASLSFDELLWLGQTAASHIDYESAELAFRQAVERSAPAEALSRARVMFARLLAERLGKKDEAQRWMERIVTEHAGTPGATFAQQWLERGRSA